MEITREALAEELAAIAFHNIADLTYWEGESAGFVPSVELTRPLTASISKITSNTTSTYTKDGDTQTPHEMKLEFYNKIRAAETLAKLLGYIGTDKEPTTVVDNSLALNKKSEVVAFDVNDKATLEATLRELYNAGAFRAGRHRLGHGAPHTEPG